MVALLRLKEKSEEKGMRKTDACVVESLNLY